MAALWPGTEPYIPSGHGDLELIQCLSSLFVRQPQENRSETYPRSSELN